MGEETRTQLSAQRLKDLLVERALSLGFDSVRVTRPDELGESAGRLRGFVEAGHHGEMSWIVETLDRRADPKMLMRNVRSVIMVGLNYGPLQNPLKSLAYKDRGIISVYAQGRDYHDIIKGRLKQIAGLLHARSGKDVKVFVDTAPLMEKPLAAAAGIGWQGKHTNLVSPQFGSWLFLGAILSEANLPFDDAMGDQCGSCRSCLDICPTKAFPQPYQLDARRCIAYLTNEFSGHIPREFRELMGNRIFGCDDCLAVCPWNKFASRTREIRFAAMAGTDNPPIEELLGLDDKAFRSKFSGTPVKRTGRDRFVRNVLIAAGNSGEQKLTCGVERLLCDPSPLVRAMAVWALRKLCSKADVQTLKARYLVLEADPDVREEWMFEEK